MDNCSAHRGQKAANRLRNRWPNLILIHTPVHASWLNQVEIYFSIVQRRVLTPNGFSSLQELEERLLALILRKDPQIVAGIPISALRRSLVSAPSELNALR